MFKQLRSIIARSQETFLVDIAGAASVTIVLLVGLYLPNLV